jgi:hypothetical protein
MSFTKSILKNQFKFIAIYLVCLFFQELKNLSKSFFFIGHIEAGIRLSSQSYPLSIVTPKL